MRPLYPFNAFSPFFCFAIFASPSLAADTCTIVVTARMGDTCVSISEAAGITVSQFLRANPSITTCSNLVTGTRYCVDPSFGPSTTARGAPASTSRGSSGGGAAPLDVSQNGQCGSGLTCLGSAYGDCCSEHGWCGGTPDHCGTGCQAAFGHCGSGGGGSPNNPPGSSNPPNNGNPSAGVTATVYITTTRTVATTTTASAGIATATQIIRQTVPVTVTVPVQGGNGGVATSTSTVIVTQASLIFISSTVTTIRTITITDAKQCRTINGPVNGPSASPVPLQPRGGLRDVENEREDSAVAAGYPSPTQPGTVPNCQTFYRIKDDDSCEGIVKRHKGALSMEQLYAWNQQLSGDCQGLWLRHWVCVGT